MVKHGPIVADFENRLPEDCVSDSDVWITGLTGVVGALLGSGAGAFASYHVNLKTREHHDEQRSAVRRKAKIYTPVRAELLELVERAGDTHRFTGQIRKVDDPHWRYHSNFFCVWPRMQRDGRSLSAAQNVATSLDRSEAAVDAYNVAVAEAREEYAAIYRDAGTALFGPPVHDSLGEVQDLLLDGISGQHRSFEPFGFSVPPASNADTNREALRQKVLDDDRSASLRTRAFTAEQSLKTELHASIRVLDAAMKEIGERYERALRRDG